MGVKPSCRASPIAAELYIALRPIERISGVKHDLRVPDDETLCSAELPLLLRLGSGLPLRWRSGMVANCERLDDDVPDAVHPNCGPDVRPSRIS